MKKGLSIVLAFLFAIPFTLCATGTDDVLVFTNDYTQTYCMLDGGMYADVDLSEVSTGDEIVLFENDEGCKVSIVIHDILPAVSTTSTGVSNWSGGYLPDGTLYIEVKVTDLFLSPYSYIGYFLTVSSYPVTILDAYNPSISATTNVTLSGYPQVSISQASPTNTQYARASMTWMATVKELFSSSTHVVASYLTCEINSMGQLRTSWRY